MKTADQIENEVVNFIQENFGATAEAIGRTLHISPRYLNKVLDKLKAEGRIQ